MKNIAVAILMLLASANALPRRNEREILQERVINEIIAGVIEDLIQKIIDKGLDPIILHSAEISYAPSEPEIFSVEAWVQRFVFSGLSNIKINNIDFSILFQNLSFDLSMPRIFIMIGDAGVKANSFGRDISGEARGALSIENIRLAGNVRLNIDVVSGISVRSISISFSLGEVYSNLNLSILGRDVSEIVNYYLNVILPNALQESKDEINELFEYIAWILVDKFLDFSYLNLALHA